LTQQRGELSLHLDDLPRLVQLGLQALVLLTQPVILPILRVCSRPAGTLLRIATTVLGLPYRRFYRDYMHAYGIIVKNRAARLYDAFVHLPVEFAMEHDGHRPVSEPFRQLSDHLLIDTLDRLEIPYHVVGGTVAERVEQILALHHLPVVVPVDEAITLTEDRVRAATAVLNTHARELAAHRSWRQRLRYALRY